MNGYVQSFFWWCAGADRDILNNCPRSERIKHAGYGSLVLVPAGLAFIAMSYAISTFTQDKSKYLFIGVVWALVVFAFDRFIVSSFRKENTISKDLVSVPFLARLVFAVLIGFVIAHPLVMFIFEESITSKLDQKQRTDIQNINALYDNQVKPLDDKKAGLDQDIANLRSQTRAELREREGDLIKATGPRRYRRRANVIKGITQRLIRERDANIEKLNVQKTDIDAKIGEIEKARNAALQKYTQPRDYLARENALSDLADESFTVRWTQRLLIFLFVFIDTLPITFKVTTRKEAYDYLIESVNKRASEESKTEDKIHEEMLKEITTRQKDRIKEVIEAKYASPDFTAALDRDIDTILRRSLVVGGWLKGRAEATGGTPASAESVKAGPADEQAAGSWSGQIKKKLKDKGVDAVISLVCIPLQVLGAFLWFLYSGRNILQYVSWSSIFEVSVLFMFNLLLGRAAKYVTQ
jgi:hypothetical protein